jgi:hypothetical protein
MQVRKSKLHILLVLLRSSCGLSSRDIALRSSSVCSCSALRHMEGQSYKDRLVAFVVNQNVDSSVRSVTYRCNSAIFQFFSGNDFDGRRL